MLNVTFHGEPFLFTGESLEDGGALTTVHAFTHGLVSYAHYWPDTGLVRRYSATIGTRADIVVVGHTEPPSMSLGEMLGALDNMLGGDPRWYEQRDEGDNKTSEQPEDKRGGLEPSG